MVPSACVDGADRAANDPAVLSYICLRVANSVAFVHVTHLLYDELSAQH